MYVTLSLTLSVELSAVQRTVLARTDTWLQHSSGWLLACSVLLNLQKKKFPSSPHVFLHCVCFCGAANQPPAGNKWLPPGLFWILTVHRERKASQKNATSPNRKLLLGLLPWWERQCKMPNKRGSVWGSTTLGWERRGPLACFPDSTASEGVMERAMQKHNLEGQTLETCRN